MREVSSFVVLMLIMLWGIVILIKTTNRQNKKYEITRGISLYYTDKYKLLNNSSMVVCGDYTIKGRG